MSRRRHLAWPTALAILLGLITTILLCWATAVVFPPNPGGYVREREVNVYLTDGDSESLTMVIRRPGEESILAFGSEFYDAVWHKPVPVQKTWTKGGATMTIPPRESNRPPADALAVAPPGTALWLMPWFDERSPRSKLESQERWMWCYGWPLPALAHVRDFRETAPGVLAYATEWSLPIPQWPGLKESPLEAREVPLRPLWLGLTIDSLLAAAVWLGLFRIFATVRAARRRRRGLCSRCAYDRRAIPAGHRCPECGVL
jgi:hypothetical protein